MRIHLGGSGLRRRGDNGPCRRCARGRRRSCRLAFAYCWSHVPDPERQQENANKYENRDATTHTIRFYGNGDLAKKMRPPNLVKGERRYGHTPYPSLAPATTSLGARLAGVAVAGNLAAGSFVCRLVGYSYFGLLPACPSLVHKNHEFGVCRDYSPR